MKTTSEVVVFQRSKPEKAAQVVAKQVKQTILNGTLAVGDRLPSERVMIEQFGYSRAIVREALRLLESDGLIVLSAGRNGGAVVTTPGTGQIMSSIDMLLRMQQTSIADVFEAQRLIEPIIVKMAIDNGTPEDFKRIRETIDLIEADPDNVELVREQSNRFHTLLGEATGNNVIAIVAGILRQIIVDFKYEGDAQEAQSIAHIHRRILDAIEAKDVEVAVRRSLRHVDAGATVMCSRG
ncbi:FadR/GntR family transcriptional regulator [Paraburkholderia aspalathi]|uniref:FadR/GntR family transcriptional regulator n=1 Tax=Paraburkholderia aspalathi TaxID=1324617 RepID=UPI001BA5B9A8|nr:FCD domain-containing protein [Paraburkholderia aspalathi]